VDNWGDNGEQVSIALQMHRGESVIFFPVKIMIKGTATRATDLSTYTDSVVHAIIALMYQFK